MVSPAVVAAGPLVWYRTTYGSAHGARMPCAYGPRVTTALFLLAGHRNTHARNTQARLL
jgi:hypothetical protein